MKQVDDRMQRFYFNNTRLDHLTFQLNLNIPMGNDNKKQNINVVVSFNILNPNSYSFFQEQEFFSQIFSDNILSFEINFYSMGGFFNHLNIFNFFKNYYPKFESFDEIKKDIKYSLQLGLSIPFFKEPQKQQEPPLLNISYIDPNRQVLNEMVISNTEDLVEKGMQSIYVLKRRSYERIDINGNKTKKQPLVTYSFSIEKFDCSWAKEKFKNKGEAKRTKNKLFFSVSMANSSMQELLKYAKMVDEKLKLKTDFLEIFYDHIDN